MPFHILSVLLALVVYRLVIYPVYICPLAKIPNANIFSPLTPLWIHWKRFWEQEIQAVSTAHRKYGSIVRLGPNELSVNIIDGGVRTVHGGNFDKTEWYGFFMNHGSVHLVLSATSPRSYSRNAQSI